TTRTVADLMVQKIREGLNSKTVKNIKNCLSSILAYAHHPEEFIDRNPVLGVKIPKPEWELPTREPDPFSREERQVLEDVYRENFPEYYPLIVTAFRTGLRMGELAGLQWGDIDFHKRILRVQRNVVHGQVTTPKSRSGKRDVRFTRQVAIELQNLRKKRKEQALRNGWGDVPEWIFCNESGNPMDPDNFRKRVWNRAMDKSGLRRRTPHDMRHTYATLRLSKGDPLAEVAKEMGHSSAQITFQIYYKWLPSESRSNIDELDDVANDHTQPSATYPQPERKKDLAV
ncbi:tyrosine-type recombinase/integrase, partial [Desulfosoma sp.]